MAERDMLELTRELLDAIRSADWDRYTALTDQSLTCFEPETHGQLVEGLEFHRFFFESGGPRIRREDTIVSPHVRMLGDDAAVVAYTRLVQREDEAGRVTTASFQETRIWLRMAGAWKHVHFHRNRETGA